MAMALLCAVLVPIAKASDRDQKIVATFDTPVQIPGQVLPLGTYVFTVMDSTGNSNIVHIWNEDQTQLVAAALTIPAYRMSVPDSPIFRLDDRSPDSPAAIREWFYPGNPVGHKFVYSLGQPAEPGAA
jgi:hypothetical protein